MEKYIELSETTKALDKYNVCGYMQEVPFSEVLETLESLPAADAQEVRHGRWVMDETPHDGDCRCSVCRVAIEQMHERHHGLLNALTGGKWWTFYRYCPHCGAQMDLEKNNE